MPVLTRTIHGLSYAEAWSPRMKPLAPGRCIATSSPAGANRRPPRSSCEVARGWC